MSGGGKGRGRAKDRQIHWLYFGLFQLKVERMFWVGWGGLRR